MGQTRTQASTTSSPMETTESMSPRDLQRGRGNSFMNDNLKNSDKSGSSNGLPNSKAAALTRHTQNRKKMDRIIKSGLAIESDPNQGFNSRLNLFRNAAQWIDQKEATMFVLSPTHDSTKRKDVGTNQTAYFDTRVPYDQEGSTYDETVDASGTATNNAGIDIDFSSVVGSMSGDGKNLTIIDPLSKSEGFLVETLIHEVQHDADQHKSGDPWAVSASPSTASEKAPASEYNRFQSEFRAYWIENPEGSSNDIYGDSNNKGVSAHSLKAITDWGADKALGGGDDIVSIATTNLKNQRQENILLQMGMDSTPDGNWWDFDKKDWNRSYAYVFYYYIVDPAYKKMVDDYEKPVGGNLIDSVRIQKLSDAINKKDSKAVFEAVDKLDALDQAYLSDHKQSQPLWTLAQSNLSATDYTRFSQLVGTPQMGPYQNTVTVVAGDTLSSIADRVLYDASRSMEIYRLNEKTIGTDPNKIEVGMKLLLPTP